ncbi:MAG: hypothetical protein JRI25_16835 [Deltaproteobacteria bacterium]|nr:hypothetical protein [Deltaproteobacteria bacterium]
MPDWLPTAYYTLDLALALAFPLAVWGLCRRGVLHARAWRLFWMGAALGLAWEVPIFALSAWTGQPVLHWPAPLPAHPAVFIVAHSLWDGALLLGGYGLAVLLERRIGRAPTSAPGLLVQVGWGQATELAVEISAIVAGTWVYLDNLAYNPVLFRVLDEPITLGPQLVWVIAPLVFAHLAMRSRTSTSLADR